MKLVKFIDFMVNVFRLCSMINSLYGQVAGDLETCSRLWQIMSPPCLRLGATRFATAVNKFPSPLPPDRTTDNVLRHSLCNHLSFTKPPPDER